MPAPTLMKSPVVKQSSEAIQTAVFATSSELANLPNGDSFSIALIGCSISNNALVIGVSTRPGDNEFIFNLLCWYSFAATCTILSVAALVPTYPDKPIADNSTVTDVVVIIDPRFSSIFAASLIKITEPMKIL